MAKWEELSIGDRYNLIRDFIDAGVTDIDEMRRYCSGGKVFDGGGYKPSQRIKDYIKNTEGFRSKWYKDGNGVDTVGYGFTGDYFKKKYPDGITREDADKEFEDILQRFVSAVARNTPNYDKMSQNQRDSLLSYMYNVGPGNYTAKSPKMQEAMRNQDWESVARYMDIGYNDSKNPGLKKRRDEERSIFLENLENVDFAEERTPGFWYNEYMKMIGAQPSVPQQSQGIAYRSEEELFNSNSPLSQMQSPEMHMPLTSSGSYIKPTVTYAQQPVPSNKEILQDMYERISALEEPQEHLFYEGGPEREYEENPDFVGPVIGNYSQANGNLNLSPSQITSQKSSTVIKPSTINSSPIVSATDGFELLDTLNKEQQLKTQFEGKEYTPVGSGSLEVRQKVYDINHKEEQQQLNAILASKDTTKIKELQRELAQDGFYSQSLNGKSKEQIKEIQRKLISKGLLSNQKNADGSYKEADGIVGKKTLAAWDEYNIDGIVGSRTRAALENKVNSKGEVQFNKNGIVAEKDKCAKFVRERFEDSVGTGYGVQGNAWTMLKNIEQAGGDMVYNIFDDPAFKKANTSNIRGLTRAAIKSNPLDTSKIKPGDVVGIFNPGTTHYAEVLNNGTTYNSHVGICTGYKNGKPIIEHNIGGKVITQVADSLQITTVARPNATPYEEMNIPQDYEQKYFVKGQEENETLNAYSKGLNNAAKYMQNIFPNVDEDSIQKIALSVLKRETNYMTNTEKQQRDSSVYSNLKYAAKDAYKYGIKREPRDSKSSDLAKFKLSSLSKEERKMLGVERKEDLENPEILAKAVTYFLSKNYDYFSRLSQQYPELGLTKEDIINLTTLSYNQGMDKLSSIGFNEEGIAPEEIRSIRNLAKEETPIDDFSSTSLARAGMLGKLIGGITGYTKSIPYSSSARLERQNSIYSVQDTTK